MPAPRRFCVAFFQKHQALGSPVFFLVVSAVFHEFAVPGIGDRVFADFEGGDFGFAQREFVFSGFDGDEGFLGVSLAKKRGSALAKINFRTLGLANAPEKLPGVGPYAAHAVPVFALDRDLPVVDWVIARVLRRYFGLTSERRPNADRDLWALAGDLAQPGQARELWLGTLDLAAAVCRPRPRCQLCPLRCGCASYAQVNAA